MITAAIEAWEGERPILPPWLSTRMATVHQRMGSEKHLGHACTPYVYLIL